MTFLHSALWFYYQFFNFIKKLKICKKNVLDNFVYKKPFLRNIFYPTLKNFLYNYSAYVSLLLMLMFKQKQTFNQKSYFCFLQFYEKMQ